LAGCAFYIDRYLPKNGAGLSVLDVGCGTGRYMAMLTNRGFNVAGVDGSKEMLDEVRANNPSSELRRADVEKIPFPDQIFDFALFVEVLSLLAKLRAVHPGNGLCAEAGRNLPGYCDSVVNSNIYWLVNRFAIRIPLGKLLRLKQFLANAGPPDRATGARRLHDKPGF
jgi:SAM-dependent methyltransferase